MLTIYLLIALLFIINTLITKFLRQKYNILDPRRIRFVNNSHKWVEISLFVVGIILLVLFWFKGASVLLYMLVGILIVVGLHRAFVEYKYEREEKEYMITLVNTGIWSVLYVTLLVSYTNSLN